MCAELGGELMRRRLMMAMGMEEDEVKEWKLLKDYTVPEGEMVSTIGTPTEEEMEGISELFIVAQTLAINKDGSAVTTTSSARPIAPFYNSDLYGYGRLSGDIVNCIGSSTSSRTLYVLVNLIGERIFGYADNAGYSVDSLTGIKSIGVFGKMPQINIGNAKNYSYTSGTNIKVYGR